MMQTIDFVKSNGIRGAIFDMDGTLTDSMSGWVDIYAVLSRQLGVELPKEFLMKYNHFSMRNCAEVIVRELSAEADAQAVYERWLAEAVKFYENVFRIKPYMLETLKALNALGVKCAIATASDRACAEAFIESNRLQDDIVGCTSLDEVSRPKSFPDIYLKAAEKLGLKPAQCIVFEDALIALRSAKNGGFYVCGVQDGASAKDEAEIKKLSDITLGFER